MRRFWSGASRAIIIAVDRLAVQWTNLYTYVSRRIQEMTAPRTSQKEPFGLLFRSRFVFFLVSRWASTTSGGGRGGVCKYTAPVSPWLIYEFILCHGAPGSLNTSVPRLNRRTHLSVAMLPLPQLDAQMRSFHGVCCRVLLGGIVLTPVAASSAASTPTSRTLLVGFTKHTKIRGQCRHTYSRCCRLTAVKGECERRSFAWRGWARLWLVVSSDGGDSDQKSTPVVVRCGELPILGHSCQKARLESGFN